MLRLMRLLPMREVTLVSLDVAGKKSAAAAPQPNQFRLLLGHLLGRFFNNDTVSTGGEALPLIMTVACTIAVPTLIAAIFVFPAYHAFPPQPPIPPFWDQVVEHFFFTMYSFVAMGCVTVFEADLLFPDRLDILILTTLPIPHRRLALARVAAVLVFLVLFLLGINSLGIVAYPLATEHHVRRLFVAQLATVTLAGAFSASVFVAAQGLFICTLGGRLYRAASTLLQGLSISALLTLLFVFPSLARSLPTLIQSNPGVALHFPPFWFLGVYESLLAGQSRLPAFAHLAHTAVEATSLAFFIAGATYPLAYRRRTRQAIEGSASHPRRSRLGHPFTWLLHGTLLRTPARRAVYHFIGQTLRTQRHRVYLAMYAGLGTALLIASCLTLNVHPGHVHLALSAEGLRLAVPGAALWIIAGLSTALDSAADPSAGWAFRVIDNKPTSDQLDAVRIWVASWAALITLAVIAVLHLLAPAPLREPKPTLCQAVVGIGLCVLLSDAFLLKSRFIPFTETRIPLNTDLAFVLLRYIILFPSVVIAAVRSEPWIEATAAHLLLAAFVLLAAHRALRYAHARILADRILRPGYEDSDGLIYTLALRD